MLGTAYFIGMVTALLFVPALSDFYGRKNVLIGTLLTSAIGQIGLLFSTSITYSLGLTFLVGSTWPGKRVVGLNFMLEQMPQQNQRLYMILFNCVDYPGLLLWSFLYQHVSASWYP